ncbi:MAG: polysaccharide deacetylase family protein [Sphingorhabdus sp.]
MFDIAAFAALALMVILLRAQSVDTAAATGAAGDKRIAISFDDAPRGAGAFLNVKQRPAMLIAALGRAKVKQAAFFANPGRIDASNGHAAAIQAYADAGHVIANHTANHLALSKVSAERFLADIDEAEAWLKPHKNYRPWLRFPRLDQGGRNAAKRDAVRAGMKTRGLRHGYVTADGWDWFIESMTIKAAKAGRPMDMAALRDFYIETHVEAADFADKLSRRALGRAPVHMLLLHETDLAALYVEDLVKALRADGWKIVSADSVYADPMADAKPVIAHANGTMIQMLSWEKGVKGPRWFERNESDVMQKLFATRVLHQ